MTADNGCDSTIYINLSTGLVNHTICYQDTVTVNGTQYHATNLTGTETFNNIGPNNCDSVVTIDLTVLPAITDTVRDTICSNESIEVGSNTYNATTSTGTEYLIAHHGCDSTVYVNLTILPAYTDTVNYTICGADNIVINGVTYDAANPTGTQVMTADNGCDSTIYINLSTGLVNHTICYQDTVTVNGTQYHATNLTGTETIKNVGPNNCDSVVTIDLKLLPAIIDTVNQTICGADNIVVNGVTYDAANPTGTEVLTADNGCDSTVYINLSTGLVNHTICYQDTVTVNGTQYHATNLTGTETFNNIGPNNCDSVVTIDLTVLPAINDTVRDTICGPEIIMVNGTLYDAATPTGTEIMTAHNGCDSTVYVNLTIAIDTSVAITSPTLSANQTGAAYRWLDCDNSNAVILGETSKDFTATANGNYAVEITYNGCVDTSACNNITGVGVLELNNQIVSIYPNPTQASFTIDLGENTTPVNYRIFTLEGRILEQALITRKKTIDLNQESKGMYFLQLGNRVYKVLKE